MNDELRLNDNGGYMLHSTGDTRGIFAVYGDVYRTSHGKLDDSQGLKASYYQEKRGRFASWRVAEFSDGKVHLRLGEQERVEQVDTPVFDFLTIMYVPFIMEQLPTPGKIWATDGWKLKQYDFTISEQPEQVETAYGRIDSWQYKRTDKNRKVWIAPQLGYIPILAEGKNIKVELVSYQRL